MFRIRSFKCVCLILLLTCVFSITSYASINNFEKGEVVSFSTTKAERDALCEQYMEEVMQNIERQSAVTRGSKYQFKTEYLPYQYKPVEGYAGNQQKGGYRFSTGGGFWYTSSGGPSVGGNISISLSSPYNIVSFSINLGNRNDKESGLFVSVPSTKYNYKLYVEKIAEVRPYVTYRAQVGTNDWKIYNVGSVSVTYWSDQYARKV